MYTAPSHPEVKEHIYSIWMDLAESYDLDGIHFDYVRYPNPDFDYSTGALDRFREWVLPRISPARRTGLDQALRSRPPGLCGLLAGALGGVPPGPDHRVGGADLPRGEEAEARPGGVGGGLRQCRRRLSPAGFRTGGVGWPIGILDAVAPMAYTPDNEIFEAQIQEAVEAAGRDRVWAGIGVYQNTYRGTVDKIRIAEEPGHPGRGSLLLRLGRERRGSAGGPDLPGEGRGRDVPAPLNSAFCTATGPPEALWPSLAGTPTPL